MKNSLLHLSDLQFGNKNRYPEDTAYVDFTRRLLADLRRLRERSEVAVGSIVVSGDLAESGAPDEFAQASSTLETLSDELDVDRSDILVVPGNHDINWLMCQASRLQAKALGRSFTPPHFEKFTPYKEFYDSFFRDIDSFTEDLFVVRKVRGLDLLLIGLNSCVRESEREDDHYGWVGVDQVQGAIQEADRIAPERQLLRIAVVHHNFLARSDFDTENLRDSDSIRPSLEEAGVEVVLHGHRHVGAVEQLRNPQSGALLTILGSGSAALDAPSLPDAPNQYSILKIAREGEVRLFMRQFAAQSFGTEGKGRWAADTSVAESGIIDLQLRDVPQEGADPAAGAETPTNQPSSLVGRHNQWEDLENLYERVKSGAGTLLLVEGELGIGKTTLITSFCSSVGDEAIFIWGRFPYARGGKAWGPLSAFRRVTRTVLGVPGAVVDQDAVVRERLSAHGVSAQRADQLINWLQGEEEAEELDRSRMRRMLFSTLGDILFSVASKRPLLVLVDDVQWADQASLHFIEYLVERTRQRSARLLVVANFRPEGRTYNINLRRTLAVLSRFSQDAVFSRVLPPLGEEEMRDLILSIDPEVPEKISRRIFQMSRGNPFLAIEIVRFNRGRSVSEEELSMPPSLRAVFEGRILEVSDAAERAVLLFCLYAIVELGGEIPRDELDKLVDAEYDESGDKVLARLQSLGLVSVLEDGSVAIQPKILLDVLPDLVESLDVDIQRIREVLARLLAGEGPTRHPPEISARIFDAAGRESKATDEYVKASLAAASGGDLEQSVAHSETAWSRIQSISAEELDSKRVVSVASAYAAALERSGKYSRAMTVLDEASALLADVSSEWRAEIIYRKGIIYTRTGEWERALDTFDRLFPVRQSFPDVERCTIELFQASAEYVLCRDVEGAIERLRETARAARGHGLAVIRGRVLAHLAIFLTETGRYPQARQAVRLAHRVFQDAGSPVDLSLLKITRGNLSFESGDLAAAAEFYGQCRKELERLQYPFGEATAILNLGILKAAREDGRSSLRETELAEERFLQLGLDHGVGQCLLAQGLGLAISGDRSRASERIDEARALMDIWDLEDPRDLAASNSLCGIVAERDSQGRALQHFSKALDLYRTVRDAKRFVWCFQRCLRLVSGHDTQATSLQEQAAQQDWLPDKWRVELAESEPGWHTPLSQVSPVRPKPNA